MRNHYLQDYHRICIRQANTSSYLFLQRIGLLNTTSFAELPTHWQHHLRWLHDDYFYHRHNQLWTAQAMESLPPLMQATGMLVCGEDLGMVPDCVQPVLKDLGLLGKPSNLLSMPFCGRI